jgi:hypothetical protein
MGRRKSVERSIGAFGFRERAGRFQDRWTGDRGSCLTDILHLLEFCGEAFLKVGTFVLLEVIRQEVETCHG